MNMESENFSPAGISDLDKNSPKSFSEEKKDALIYCQNSSTKASNGQKLDIIQTG